VTQETLDVTDIYAGFDEQGRGSMSEHVGCDSPLHSRAISDPAQLGSDRLRPHRSPNPICKQLSVITGLQAPLGYHRCELGSQQLIGDVCDTITSPLAVNTNYSTVRRCVFESQAAEFPDTETCGNHERNGRLKVSVIPTFSL
jgi:hypothetical protein